MPETVAQPTTITAESDMSFRTQEQKIESCVLQLKNKGVDKASAFAMATAFIYGAKKASEADELIKQLAETTSKYSVGLTSKDGDPKHSHAYTVFILNYGQQLVGVTTATQGADNHVHSINMRLDSKLTYIEGYTAYSSAKVEGDNTSTEMHEHLIKIDIEKLTEENPNITVSGYYFNENGEFVKGDIKDALAKMFEEIKTPIVLNDNTIYVIPADHCTDNKGHYSFNTKRQAEILINRIAYLFDKPVWYKNTLAELQASVVLAIDSKYPDNQFDDMNIVGEMTMNLAAGKKLDPKAKVRNKTAPVFPAGSADVTDNKDHFPLSSENQARNALARCAQYKASPSWYKGSLAALQQKVRRAVKAKYPKIDVSKLTEFYALRFREGSDIFFISLSTLNVNSAKHDASVYYGEAKNAEIEVIKFESKEDGESKFTDIGSVMLYDKSNAIRTIGADEPINLSERNTDGLVKIEMLREGTFHHEVYGDFVIDENKLSEMIKNYQANVLDRELSIDMQHMPELPAAIWIKKLELGNRNIKGKNRKCLYGYGKPTPIGEKAIKDEEFKYFSAEYSDHFIDKETGKDYGITLKGGGLTNRPWMPGLAPVQRLSEYVGFVDKVI